MSGQGKDNNEYWNCEYAIATEKKWKTQIVTAKLMHIFHDTMSVVFCFLIFTTLKKDMIVENLMFESFSFKMLKLTVSNS